MNLNKKTRTSCLSQGWMHRFDLRISRTLCICLLLCSCLSVCRAASNDPNKQSDRDNDLLLAKMPTTNAERDLWQARMKAAEPSQASQSKEDLKALMQQISAIKFKEIESEPVIEAPAEAQPEPQVQTVAEEEEIAEPVAIIEPVIPEEPNEVVAQAPEVGTQPESLLSERTLEIFQELLQQPEQLKNPYELAEVLFRSNCPKEAAICYQVAFDRLVGDDDDPHHDKAWILFQLGNCLEDEDPQAALDKYRTLMTEYPDCPWVDVAKAKSRVIDWRLKDNPVGLIKECKS